MTNKPDKVEDQKQEIAQENWDFYKKLKSLSQELQNEPLQTEVKTNKFAEGAKYVPIERVESKLDFYFPLAWQTKDFQYQVVANEIICSIQLLIWNPYFGDWIQRTGAGAAPIQFEKDTDITYVANKKKNTLGKDFPSAKAEAIKNAAKSLGRTFGRDLNRDVQSEPYSTFDELQDYINKLYECKTGKELSETFKGFPKDVQQSQEIQSKFRYIQSSIKYANQKGNENE